MKDELGDRMKSYYEDRTRNFLPRRTFTIIRIDGKAFHTYTRGLNRPFDEGLIDDMNQTTKYLCENIQGAKFGYVQSDEISLVLTDFEKITTDAWFNGNIQKMASISASMATAKFNELRMLRFINEVKEKGKSNVKQTFALFDSRVFTIPSEEEVINYFIWRQQDATRNSISAVAQSLYSHKELNGKSTNEMQEMIFQKEQNWNDYKIGQKRGRAIAKRAVLVQVSKTAAEKAKDKSSFIMTNNGVFIERNCWTIIDPPVFTSCKEFIRDEIIIKIKKEV
jgi:tRNA(His) 5'-end guanylyltransferase